MITNKPPFSPSIIDRINDWVNRKKLPAWLIFFIFYLLFLLINQGSSWIEGTAAFWTFAVRKIQVSIWPVMALAMIYYLDRVALTAAENFRPLIKTDEEVYNKKIFQLTNMPARPVWMLFPIGPLMVILKYFFDFGFVVFENRTITAFLWKLIMTGITFPLFPIFIYHTIRQLNIVSQIQSDLGEIDLFRSTPLYSFSVLTARTGIAWIITLSTTVLYTIFFNDPQSGASTSFIIAFTTIEVVLALASFILPLVSLHTKMEKAKGFLLDEINQHIKNSIRLMGNELEALDPGKASAQRDLVETLRAQHSYVRQLPTWPWRSTTFRGFLSVIFLPVLLMVIQQLIENLF
ncbi:MAG TPA: hypothetical protein VJ965_12090 [Anaerolineales bacterium]|nr:hypothetical protein [Anaerolineales bacterium]